MSSPKPLARAMTLVQHPRDEDADDEQFKPLEWGLIRRLFTYTAPIKSKVIILVIMTIVRSAQLPALGCLMAVII